MTAEDECKFCKSLIRWGKYSKFDTMYMEERIYAVKLPNGVALVEAKSEREAAGMIGSRIPIKPDVKATPLKGENFRWFCPNCKAAMHTMTMHNYCHRCSQAIDWSDYK